MRLAAVLAVFGAVMLSACETTRAPPANDGPVLITLERTPCFGFCPDYTVSIDGDGNVAYNGRRFVAVSGEQHGKASREDVAALLRAFDDVRFESLNGEYRARVTDLPTQIVTLTRNGHTKRVVDYAGVSVGMPQAVADIEAQIDRVANTRQWVLRNGEPARN
jgi:hypothetical protein